MSNLQVRVVSAVVLLAFVLPATWYGGVVFRILAAAIGLALAYEWCLINRCFIDRRSAVLLGAAIVAVAAGLVFGLVPETMLVAVAALAAALALCSGALGGRHAAIATASGFAYAALAMTSLAWLRADSSAGLAAIALLFAIVWATDIFAYFGGRAIGGPKLAPAISPGKTISGAVSGLIAAVIAALLLAWLAFGGAGLSIGLLAACLSVVSQCGDLFESALKRRAGVKDSSALIPGHGGVFDRVDGLVPAAIAMYATGAALAGAAAAPQGLLSLVGP